MNEKFKAEYEKWTETGLSYEEWLETTLEVDRDNYLFMIDQYKQVLAQRDSTIKELETFLAKVRGEISPLLNAPHMQVANSAPEDTPPNRTE